MPDRLCGIHVRGRHVAEKALSVVGPDAAAVRHTDLLAQPAALAVRSGNFRADGPAGKETSALTEDVAVNTIGRSDLRSGETIGLVFSVRAAGKILCCFE